MQPDNNETEFRISGDPSVSLTAEEVAAQRAALKKIDEAKRLAGKIRELSDDAPAERAREIEHYRQTGVRSADVRAGNNKDMRLPDDESLQAALDAGDMETAHLIQLGRVQPGTPEFMAKAPPPEEVIEVFGPKGPESFGVVRRVRGVGPGAGEVEIA